MTLIVVGTPIGNLGDLSPRAVDALRRADAIACEDTRHTRKLLTAAGIRARTLVAVHEHNEASMAPRLLERLERGETVALVTDAGMPSVSDPGEQIVAAAADAGYEVQVVPGPSAVVAAVAVSGLASERWCFEGFLPRKGAERRRRIAALAAECRTSVLYESPHRLLVTLHDLAEALGADRRVAVARELTKVHEQVWRGTLAGAAAHVETAGAKGEYVLVIEGAEAPPVPGDEPVRDLVARLLAGGLSTRDAAAAAAAQLGVPKSRAYEIAVLVLRQVPQEG